MAHPDRGRAERRVGMVLTVAAIGLVGWTLPASAGLGLMEDLDDAVWIVAAAVFAATGAVIVRAHPRHVMGWAFIWIGVFSAVTNAGIAYGVLGVDRALPLADVAAWMATWTWAPPLGLLVLAIATFPDGRAINRGVRGLAALGLVAALVISAVNAVLLWPLRDAALALPGAESELDNVVPTVIGILFPVILVGAVVSLASLLVRFRRSRGGERQQLKWLAVAALVMGVGIVGSEALPAGSPALAVTDVLGVPLWFAIAAGVAVLRYRLYDVDRIVSRTLSYVLVTAILLLVYAGSVLAFGTLARAIAGESGDLVVALSTLLVAAAFAPVRRRVQSIVDRRFNRARVDALQAADDFGRRLRDEVDLSAVVAELRGTVARTLQPASTSVLTVGPVGGGRA